MTDNEKAATFIGWEPETRCLNKEGYETFSGFVPSLLPPRHNARCLTCGWESLATEGEVVLDPHMEPAPDMSKPENYMRALESLTPHGPWSIGCWDGVTIGPLVSGGRKIGPFVFKALQCDGHIEAVIKALAALYDAEHPEEARK